MIPRLHVALQGALSSMRRKICRPIPRGIWDRRSCIWAPQVRSGTFRSLKGAAREAGRHRALDTTTGYKFEGCARGVWIPAILHEHANHGDTPWFQKVADRLLAPHTDIAIAVSESTGEFTTRARLMPAERTKVVYLGAPLDEFARQRSPVEIAEARASMGIAPGTIAIGTITRLMPSKGNQYLIDAAPKILAKHPDVRFFVVGEGELQAPLQDQARALGLGDRFVFSGFMRDVAAALSALDIVVFPSLWEGTPLTVFETLAMGKPIVAMMPTTVDVLTDRQDA